MKDEKAIELLKRLRRYVDGSVGERGVNAVYIQPAQLLRNQADAMEAKDELIKEVDEFLKKTL